MSRIGKNPIAIPANTIVTVADGVVSVKGPKGELRRKLVPEVVVAIENGEAQVSPTSESGEARALWGTYASHLRNMLVGVNEPFVKKLIVEGVGFKSNVAGSTLTLDLGFSHDVPVAIPEGLAVTAEKNLITISGIDKEQVGQFAADVRALKKPEPYKGKGIRYEDEIISRKQGKKTA